MRIIDEYYMEKTQGNVVSIKTRKIDLDKRLDSHKDERVAVEAPARFFLNGKSLTTIMASPSNLKEMAVGFLIDEGVIPRLEDIMDITVDRNEVWVKSKKINLERIKSINENGVIVTSCSSRTDFNRVIDELRASPLMNNYLIESKDVLEMVKESINKSIVFRSTGGVHSASIFVHGVMEGFAEDVGRHNAVDKAIGVCLLKGVPLEEAVLITSGRQPADIVLKAARCKIPISVSLRAPLSSGVYAADLTGVTLICFARGRRMNIYSHPERVKPLKAS
jgi:FdhD protein